MQATPTPASDAPAYLLGVLADELALADLLRWTRVESPQELTPNFWLWGTRGGTRENGARGAHTFMPRWRRAWGCAGELVEPCGLSIQQGLHTVAVTARSGHAAVARYADYPTRDAAILYAICHAAIDSLAARRAGYAALHAADSALRDYLLESRSPAGNFGGGA